MNKTALKNQIYMTLKNRTPKITKAISDDIVDIVIDTMRRAIVTTQRLSIRRFGIFEIKHCKERAGWNPITNKPMTIQNRSRIKFRPSDELVQKINS